MGVYVDRMIYLNEHDKGAAEWIRQLMAADVIQRGTVDERDIEQLQAFELSGYERVHLFAGIGGWEYALERAGFPAGVPVWTGSCPCQPFSNAGEQKAEEDHRHLWPVMEYLVSIGRPPIVFGEQVASKLGREWLSRVRTDLEALGYAFGAADLCAAGVSAPHIRQRLYWMAYLPGDGRLQRRSESDGRCLVSGGRSGGMGDLPGFGWSRSGPARGWGLGSQDSGSVSHSLTQTHTSESLRVAHTNVPTEARFGQHRFSVLRDEKTGKYRASDAWSCFDIVHCRDNKNRRVESGTFPLAHGVPGRVGLLRGYGNAIAPDLAAAFVISCMECIWPN